jgi:hypothetical protein
VSYLGPFNKEFRELLLARDFQGSCQRLGIPVTKDLQARLGGGRVGCVGRVAVRVKGRRSQRCVCWRGTVL